LNAESSIQTKGKIMNAELMRRKSMVKG